MSTAHWHGPLARHPDTDTDTDTDADADADAGTARPRAGGHCPMARSSTSIRRSISSGVL